MRNLAEKIKNTIKTLKNDSTKRTKLITITTMFYNFVWAIGKILFGAMQATYLYLLSGCYTLLIGFVKKIFLSNHSKANINRKTKSFIMGILLLLAGLAYAIYMGRLFFMSDTSSYSLIWSIAIAVGSFGELGISIYNLCKVSKKNDILLFSLRCCSFVSAIFAIVITQAAILSATTVGTKASIYNAITGIVAGLIAIIVGCFVIIKADNSQKQNKIKLRNNQTQPNRNLKINENIIKNKEKSEF